MIDVQRLTKLYGDKTAVDDLTLTVRPGRVTGFLGPNGAGKSTTMRMIIGLDRPTSGTVTVNGKRYARHAAPLREIGSLLEARSVHPGRSAFAHLMALAHTHGISRRRVDEVIEPAGLTSVAHKRAGAFSLGMGQRLGIAAALIAERLVVVGRGRLLADTTVEEFIKQAGGRGVKVATTEPERLWTALSGPDVTLTSAAREELVVEGMDSRRIGTLAAQHGIPLYELTPQTVSLEEAFMELTSDTVEYQSATNLERAA
ncbi:ABC transporter ATP-binding protein [Streptomyces sp. T028]|uniref:ABC transporter ATP-binding protein n=1 Tax=Streptomyces sp. T028 TaxID=3394379 RepID=UPI003A8750EF